MHFTHPDILSPDELTKGISAETYARRRNVLLSNIDPNCVVILPGHSKKIMTHDIPYPFRQESSFMFLTGYQEPGCVAAFVRRSDDVKKWILFVPEKNASDELWHGNMTGTDAAKRLFGCDEAYSIKQVKDVLPSLLREMTELACQPPTVILNSKVNPDEDKRIMKAIEAGGVENAFDARPILWALRACKDKSQIAMQMKAADVTGAAFRAAMQCTRPGLNEHHICAIMDFVIRLNGGQGLAYPPVIAGGRNGLILHYISNMHTLKDGDLLLVDAGAEYHCHPTDVTRTWPVSGKFTEPQKDVYNAVLRVQEYLINIIRPGAAPYDFHKTASSHLHDELLKLGVLSVAMPQHRRDALMATIFPHSTGHPMGMDIHESIPGRVFLERGMYTVEPGVYIPDAPDIPEKYHGISVRIEDNIILSSDGNVVTTKDIPKTVSEIEEVMATRSSLETSFLEYVMAHASM